MEAVTGTKNRDETVIYENNDLTGNMVTIQIFNNQNGKYLELRGIECTMATPNVLQLTGAEEATMGEGTVTYVTSVRDTVDLATATLTYEYDEDLLTEPVLEGRNGWNILWHSVENGVIKVVVYNNDGVTTDQPADILAVTFTVQNKAGSADVALVKALLSGYVGEGEQYLTPAYRNASVTTAVKYRLYDVNRDGVVNQLDITRAQRYFGKADPICDVDGDGEVGIGDMILIANNYTK